MQAFLGRKFPLAVYVSLAFLIATLEGRGQEPEPAIVDQITVNQITLADSAGEVSWQVKAIPKPEAWNRFLIFVWQYKTDAIRDAELYRDIGLEAFHIDRGAGEGKRAEWATMQKWPFYVDHAAGKGILHMTDRTGVGQLPNDGSLAARPQSLISADNFRSMKQQLTDNLGPLKNGPIACISLDDETSLGTFNSPIEVDNSTASVAAYRQWLMAKYGSLEAINKQWNSQFTSADEITPFTFEQVRSGLNEQPFPNWNLSRWIDWRTYMDRQFAVVTANLVKHSNTIISDVPAGIVGGQQPSAFGGYNYDNLQHAVQWMEAYDIGGTNELLTSFWSDVPRRPVTQTFFCSGNAKQDAWFLWYYLAHGNAGVIAWPDSNGQGWFDSGSSWSYLKNLESTFRETQKTPLAVLSDSQCELQFDSIAILYSHPSVQASWVCDALTHGKTWPRRSSGIDNNCQSAGASRVAWSRLLEDLGYQAKFITTTDLTRDALSTLKTKVLILPRSMALSDLECETIEKFVQAGGTVIADYWTGVLDEHGRGRNTVPLDQLFGIKRDYDLGSFDGKTVTEIDGEKYQQPLLERLVQNTAVWNSLTVVERGLTAAQGTRVANPSLPEVNIRNTVDLGQTYYLNLSPVAYSDNTFRLGPGGTQWRSLIKQILASANLTPKATLWHKGEQATMAEILHWKLQDRSFIAIVSNPARQAAIDSQGKMDNIFGDARDVELRLGKTVSKAIDLRRGTIFPNSDKISFSWNPWEAEIFEIFE